MKTSYGLIGAGGFGREVIPVWRSMLEKEIQSGEAELFFVDEKTFEHPLINGYKVISLKDFCQLSNPKKFNVSIGNGKVRQRIADICIAAGASPLSIISPNAVQLDLNEVQAGAILSPFVTITSNATIGRFFHANIYSYVAHDCIIGDYVTFAPGVKCNGNVSIENYAYIGTGAIIKQGETGRSLIIGEGAIIGMGAIVTKHVLPYTTVVGNPARELKK